MTRSSVSTASARSVFKELVLNGVSTRPRIGQELGLSRPTMSAAFAELEKLGFVEKVGKTEGTLGRKATEYRVGPAAGHIVAVDAGSTHVRLRVSSLDRRLLHSRVHALAKGQQSLSENISAAVAEEFTALSGAADQTWGPRRALGIAVPSRVVPESGDVNSTGQNLIFSRFERPMGYRVLLENNVNCAAVAEKMYGSAKGCDDFAFVQIGFKIGMGLMLSGELVRGHNGAAGEIGHLAFPFAPDATPEPGEMERYLGTEALLARVRSSWPGAEVPPPKDTSDLLALAERGNPSALSFVHRHAQDIGALVASCVSVTDPGLVVLGGGYGMSPLLPKIVGEVANRLSYRVEVRSTTLGPDATVLGIEKLAIDQAIEDILVTK